MTAESAVAATSQPLSNTSGAASASVNGTDHACEPSDTRSASIAPSTTTNSKSSLTAGRLVVAASTVHS